MPNSDSPTSPRQDDLEVYPIEALQPAQRIVVRQAPTDPRLEINYMGMRNPAENLINRQLSEAQQYLNTSLFPR